MPRRAILDEKDKACLDALASYRSTGKQCYRDQVFFCVREACYAVAKRLLGGVRTRDFSGKVLDATCKVMARLDRNGEKDTPKKLSTFCYVYVLKALYDPKIVNEEKLGSLTDLYLDVEKRENEFYRKEYDEESTE